MNNLLQVILMSLNEAGGLLIAAISRPDPKWQIRLLNKNSYLAFLVKLLKSRVLLWGNADYN